MAIKPPPKKRLYNRLYNLKTMNVKFDGEHISFPVNGVEIVDGKFPDSLLIDANEHYQLDGKSVALLAGLFNENSLVELKTRDIVEKWYGYSYTSFATLDICRIRIFSHDSYVTELVQKLEKKEKELADIKKVIDSHNKKTWYDRIERISYNSEE